MVTKNLVNTLRRLNITHAYLDDDHVIVYLEGRVLPKHRIKLVESEEWVASWWKERANNTIRVDNRIQKRHFLLSLVVHEVIEKWLMYDSIWKLPYDIAHSITDTIEKKWHVKKWGLTSWNNYMKRVEQLWEEEQIQKMNTSK